MIEANKWDFKKHKYERTQIDDNCSLYETDMEKIVKCPNCNKDVKFGDCYTSKQYHNNIGLGYAVCEDCYNNEWKLYKENKKKADDIDGRNFGTI